MNGFHLTREIIDQIVFGMENQDHVFLLDLDELVIVPETAGDTDDTERYARLPQWKSVDGYNLMSKFVASLGNPIYREKLRSILASGRRVFRQFKDTLGERPEIERLWFSFKQKEMRLVVSEWFNDLRELRGLERLEMSDTDETEPLIASDFTLVEDDGSSANLIDSLDREAFRSNYPDMERLLVDLLYRRRRAAMPDPGGPDTTTLLAQTPAGDTVGFLWATQETVADTTVSTVLQLYIFPEYRGMGLAKALLSAHLESCHTSGVSSAFVDLHGIAGELEDSLVDEGFEELAVSLILDLKSWSR